MDKISKKDLKFLKFAQDAKLALHDELVENNDKLAEAKEIFSGLDVNKLQYLKGEKGDKGDSIKGDRGPIGMTGPIGRPSTVPGPRGFKGEDGYTPVKGVDYFDGVDGNKIFEIKSVDKLPTTANVGDVCIINDTKDVYIYE